MRAATERTADVLAQHADIRALAARHGEPQEWRLVGQQFKTVDRHLPRLAFERDARTRIFIERLAVALQG